jgi:hypothetical protein
VLLEILHPLFCMVTAFGDPGTITAGMHDNGVPCDWKHCETCNICRPFRAKHCPQPRCNRCVSRFDHHCGFIDVCVGAGNEVSFMFFCLFAFLDCFLSGLNGVWVLLAPSDGSPAAPGLLSLFENGRILSMDSIAVMWQRIFVVSFLNCR